MTAAAIPEQDGPTYAQIRRRVAQLLLRDRNEWAGCPIPIDGLELVVEPSYPYQFNSLKDGGTGLEEGEVLVNFWYSKRRGCEVYIIHKNGRAMLFKILQSHANRRLEILLATSKASWVHDTDAEMRAMGALQSHLSQAQWDAYLLLGHFVERSKRSGVVYVFRRLRPTIALSTRREYAYGLCTLCMHPIAYYRGTWMGAMTPSDDVLTHLLMMRSDEPMFWRRSNQARCDSAEGGL